MGQTRFGVPHLTPVTPSRLGENEVADQQAPVERGFADIVAQEMMRIRVEKNGARSFSWEASLLGLTLLVGLLLSGSLWAQTTPTQEPSQTPKTAPQTAQILPSYEGQNVSSVEIAGQPTLDTQKLQRLLAQQSNQPFSQANVDQSIAKLKHAGPFNDIQLEVRPDPNGVRVLFVLQPAVYFAIYEFPGATNRFPYSRLLQVANYPPRGEYTPVDVRDAQDSLQTFFKRNGYFLSEVRPEVQTDIQHGLANVLFRTSLNRRAKFGEVVISGTSPDEARHLEDLLHSLLARMRGSAIRPGKTFNAKTLQNATQYLQNKLTKENHLAAQVKLLGAKYNPETNRADIDFNVQTGPVVQVRVEGAHLWSWTKKKLLPVYEQLGVNQELIQEGRQNLISHFQSKGYFDTKVDAQVTQQPGGETVLYQISKGPRHKVADVSISGNQHIPAKQLDSHVAVEKARFFSHGKYSQKLVRTSANNLKRVYQAAGFSTVKVTPQVTTNAENVVILFRVEEGAQDIVSVLRIEGNDTLSQSQLAPKGLKVVLGQPFSQKSADEDRNRIVARYLELGYLSATFKEVARPLPNDPHQIEVTYKINEGPRVYTASIVTLGRQTSQQRLITQDISQIQSGRPLKEDELLSSESKLYNLGVFDWAEIDPRRQITTQTQEDVIVKVHEAKRNSLTYGFGFEVINRGGSVPSGTVAVPGLPLVGLPSTFKTSERTFYGPRATFQYTRNNVRGKAESISFSGLAGRLEQRASVIYTDPMFRWTKWSANTSLSGEHSSKNPIFTSRQGQIGFQLQRALDEKKTKNVFLRYSFSETRLTNLLIADLVPIEDQHVRLSTLSASYTRDTRDNSLDAHKGLYESYEFDLNPAVLGSNVSFARLLTQAAYYKQVPNSIIWANSVRLGLEQSFANSRVPLSETFFSGGGGTLRGFPLNGAGPQRTIPACGNPADKSTCSFINLPVGGNQLVIINSELRIPAPIIKKGLGIAAFYDGGNVYRRIGFHDFGANYTNTVGAGLRYATPVGPLRVDLGHNLNAPPGIKSTQIFITLGQAF